MADNYDIALVRVDNRLVHGQILEAWVPYIKAKCIIVVNDSIASDFYNETVIRMAVPSKIEVIFISVDEFTRNFNFSRNSGKKTIVLFSNIADVTKAYGQGFHFDRLNIGNIYNEECQLCCSTSVFLCKADIQDILTLLEEKGVSIELKRVPRERAVNIQEAIREYCNNHK